MESVSHICTNRKLGGLCKQKGCWKQKVADCVWNPPIRTWHWVNEKMAQSKAERDPGTNGTIFCNILPVSQFLQNVLLGQWHYFSFELFQNYTFSINCLNFFLYSGADPLNYVSKMVRFNQTLHSYKLGSLSNCILSEIIIICFSFA